RYGVGGAVNLIVGDSREKRPELGPADLIFIDGDHTYEGCAADIRTWYDHLVDHGHLVFHDSYLGPHGVQDAILDFLDEHDELEIVVSPFIGACYWDYSAGSIAHL